LPSVSRDTKVISAILFITALSLVGAYYLDRQNFVDWSDVKRVAEYDECAILGSTITIEYYLVNDRSVDIKVERKLSFMMSNRYTSDTEDVVAATQNISPASKYITIPANDRVPYGSETFTLTKTGQFVVQKTTFPEVRIDVVPEYSYEMKLNSEPHLVRGGNCYYTIDITMLNNGVSDINVRLENVRICDIAYPNMTVDERGYDIVPDYAGYVLVPVNGTQSIRYVTGEVVHDSIFYVRIEFTLHIYELDKMEMISTWLHRKLITS
jgi:hypothetical protein